MNQYQHQVKSFQLKLFIIVMRLFSHLDSIAQQTQLKKMQQNVSLEILKEKQNPRGKREEKKKPSKQIVSWRSARCYCNIHVDKKIIITKMYLWESFHANFALAIDWTWLAREKEFVFPVIILSFKINNNSNTVYNMRSKCFLAHYLNHHNYHHLMIWRSSGDKCARKGHSRGTALDECLFCKLEHFEL